MFSVKDLFFVALLLLGVAIATGSGGNAQNTVGQSPVRVTCAQDALACQLFLNLNTGGNDPQQQQLIYSLERDESSVFAESAQVVFADGTEPPRNVHQAGLRTSSSTVKFRTKAGDVEGLFALAWIAFEDGSASSSGPRLDRAIIATLDSGFFEYSDGELKTYRESRRRRLGSETVSEEDKDVVLDLPEGQPWMTEEESSSTAIGARLAPETYLGDLGRIVKFAPGCFPDDHFVHSFQMNVILDMGVFQELTATVTSGGDSAKTAKVMDDLEFQFSIAKLVYESQLNIRLQIKQVMIGRASDPKPISGSRQSGTCLNAVQSHSELIQWNIANSRSFQAGYTMLFSKCFTGGINGVSYVGGVCQSTSNVGVAAFDWFVLAHELGHGFGMNHAFQLGVGRTGGIMDYGNPKYNGAAQFHPTYNKLEVCRFLTGLKNKAVKCQFFTSTGQSTGGGGNSNGCGDGVLAPGEQCECLTSGQTNCGKCSNCKITDASVQCSAGDFMLRTASMTGSLAVSKSSIASSECCINNRLARPKTTCGTGGKNTCSAEGKCAAVCTKAMGSTASPCGYDDSGCMMGCIWQGKCRFDMIFGTNQALVSAVPNGTPCLLNGGRAQGVCQAAKCVSAPGKDVVPTTTTSSPTTTTTRTPFNCAQYRRRTQCSKVAVNGCRWCNNRCSSTCGSKRRGLEDTFDDINDDEDDEVLSTDSRRLAK